MCPAIDWTISDHITPARARTQAMVSWLFCRTKKRTELHSTALAPRQMTIMGSWKRKAVSPEDARKLGCHPALSSSSSSPEFVPYPMGILPLPCELNSHGNNVLALTSCVGSPIIPEPEPQAITLHALQNTENSYMAQYINFSIPRAEDDGIATSSTTYPTLILLDTTCKSNHLVLSRPCLSSTIGSGCVGSSEMLLRGIASPA